MMLSASNFHEVLFCLANIKGEQILDKTFKTQSFFQPWCYSGKLRVKLIQSICMNQLLKKTQNIKMYVNRVQECIIM